MENIFIVQMPLETATMAFHTLKEAQDYIKNAANEEHAKDFSMVEERIAKWYCIKGVIKLERWAYIHECPLKKKI